MCTTVQNQEAATTVGTNTCPMTQQTGEWTLDHCFGETSDCKNVTKQCLLWGAVQNFHEWNSSKPNLPPCKRTTYYHQVGLILGMQRWFSLCVSTAINHITRMKDNNHLNRCIKNIWQSALLFHDKNTQMRDERKLLNLTKSIYKKFMTSITLNGEDWVLSS